MTETVKGVTGGKKAPADMAKETTELISQKEKVKNAATIGATRILDKQGGWNSKPTMNGEPGKPSIGMLTSRWLKDCKTKSTKLPGISKLRTTPLHRQKAGEAPKVEGRQRGNKKRTV